MVPARKLSPLICAAQLLRALQASAAAAAFIQFESNKPRTFTCSIIGIYANRSAMQQRRGFLMRGLALIAWRGTPSLIRRFIAGLYMVNRRGCRNHYVLALTVYEPLRFSHPLQLS